MPTPRKTKPEAAHELADDIAHEDAKPDGKKQPVPRRTKGAATSAVHEVVGLGPLGLDHAAGAAAAPSGASFEQFVQTVVADATAVEQAIVTVASDVATIATDVAEAVSAVESIVHGGGLVATQTTVAPAVAPAAVPEIVVTPAEAVAVADSTVAEVPVAEVPVAEVPATTAEPADGPTPVAALARPAELAELLAFAGTLTSIQADMTSWHALLVAKTEALQTDAVAFDQVGDACATIEERVAHIETLHEHIVRDSEAFLELRGRRAAALASFNAERVAELVRTATDRWIACRHRMEALFDSL